MSVRVDGRPLTPLLPYGLHIEAMGDDFMIVEPTDRSFAGRLILPFLAVDGVRMYDLDVPSSGNFTHDDLRELWLAGQELASWQSRRALATTTGAYATPQSVDHARVLADWHALEKCARQAEMLLREWPTRMGRVIRWVPVGVGGGFEDLDHTEREVGRLGYLAKRTDADLVVTRSARWFGKSEPLTLGAAAYMAERVVALVTETVSPDDLRVLRHLISPIQRVAHQALNPAGKTDPDPSSWPNPFLLFVAACMQVLAELEARERGNRAVPFLDTDELFETWLAVRVRDILSGRLEPAPVVSHGAIASWLDDAITYDLRIKPSIRRSTPLGAHKYRALVAQELVPDVVVSATRGDITEFAVLDAKAWAHMLPEEALTESAKYLYGVRRIDDDSLPAIASVCLVSCALKPDMPDHADARIDFVWATPTVGVDVLESVVEQTSVALAAAVEAREQEASLH